MKPETKWIMNYLDQRELIPEMDKAINLIYHWTTIDFKYESKNARISEWNPSDSDIYALLCHIMAGLFIHGTMTYQAIIGLIQHDIRCADQIDRIKTSAEVIALAYQCDLLVITKEDDTMYISTEFVLDEDMPDFLHHQPEQYAYVAEHNQILGCRFKQHDEDTCIEHINTMNAVPLALEWRVINKMDEPMKHDDTDTPEEHRAKKIAHDDMVRRSNETYSNIGTSRFFLKHHYDTRGRTYDEGYYVNYQGSSFKKAIVQLYHKELI